MNQSTGEVLCDNTAAYLNNLANIYPQPWGGVCGGHGTCVNGVCVCDAGWTGRSDFINTEDITCDVSDVAVHVLWFINFASLAWSIGSTRHIIHSRWKRHWEQVEKHEARGQRYRIRDNRGLLAILVFLVLDAPAGFLLGIIMMATEDQRVGLSWGVTILFFLVSLGFYLMVFFFQPQLLALILRGCRAKESVVQAAKNWGLASLSFSIIAAALPFITLLFSDGRDVTAQAVYMSYFSLNVVALTVYGTQAFGIQYKFNQLMSENDVRKDSASDQIRKRMVSFQRVILFQATVQGVIFLTFLLIPYFYNKHEYFMPISWIGGNEIFRNLIRTSAAYKPASSSSDTTATTARTGTRNGLAATTNVVSSAATSVSSTSTVDRPAPVSLQNFSAKASVFFSPDKANPGEDDSDDAFSLDENSDYV
ncbi:Teneurin-2 [Hondaea fermentalgiana]|uniref:Teneurin-2 n=1 Tax=Hondaea fermentalgiana TaxID=2315210 RepID=A0A2R5GNX0_9STRA|nr:Teneurin-2 [Hondaea fermentalgiana]|eukprot:GBG31999.1 Teneurin-2 [Hondaea fermentalgiana]